MKKLLFFILILLFTIAAGAENSDNQPKTPASTVLSVLLEHVKLSGYGQVGYTYNSFDPTAGNKPSNSFDIKRIMFMADAQITNRLKMYFMYDFANAKLHEYWGEYRFCNALYLRGGQFKAPFTIESLLSPSILEIISGAQSVQYLAGINSSDVCYTGQAGRDLGVMLWGDLIPIQTGNLLGYKIGVFNGQGMNQKDKNRYKDIVGMLIVNPVKPVSLVGSFYIGHGYANEDNPFGAFKKGENYKRTRWSVGTEITTAPIYIRAEFLQGKDAFIKSYGGYVTTHIPVARKFDLIASYDYFNKSKSYQAEQTNYILGAQWNFYRRCRFQAQYVFQDRGKGNHNANLVMTQLQLGF